MSIGDRAFANCKNLVYIHLPSTLNSIAENAFDGIVTFVLIMGNKDVWMNCKKATICGRYSFGGSVLDEEKDCVWNYSRCTTYVNV